AGLTPAELVRCAVGIDYTSLLIRRKSWVQLMVALLLKYRYERTRPLKGVFGTQRLEDFINSKVPVWPENFWTVAMDGNDLILFTAGGVFRRTAPGAITKIADTPPSVGTAVCASCAVPG